MADKITITNTLSVETIYTDADTRTFNLPNPRAGLSSADITALSDYLAENNLLIGDKTGAQFGRITKATKISKETTLLDITS